MSKLKVPWLIICQGTFKLSVFYLGLKLSSKFFVKVHFCNVAGGISRFDKKLISEFLLIPLFRFFTAFFEALFCLFFLRFFGSLLLFNGFFSFGNSRAFSTSRFFASCCTGICRLLCVSVGRRAGKAGESRSQRLFSALWALYCVDWA